jgi:hypothetical protein
MKTPIPRLDETLVELKRLFDAETAAIVQGREAKALHPVVPGGIVEPTPSPAAGAPAGCRGQTRVWGDEPWDGLRGHGSLGVGPDGLIWAGLYRIRQARAKRRPWSQCPIHRGWGCHWRVV